MDPNVRLTPTDRKDLWFVALKFISRKVEEPGLEF
jgi:hypothetical protein